MYAGAFDFVTPLPPTTTAVTLFLSSDMAIPLTFSSCQRLCCLWLGALPIPNFESLMAFVAKLRDSWAFLTE